jgi:hypothetical protein
VKTPAELREEARKLMREADALEAYGQARKAGGALQDILRAFAEQHEEFLKRQG